MAKLASKYVVGIDPGGAHTGIIVRQQRNLQAYDLLHRKENKRGKEPAEQYGQRVAQRAIALAIATGGQVEFRVERVIAPRWYSKGSERPVDPKHLIDVALVAGTIAGRLAAEFGANTVWWVRPNKHGHTPEVPAGPKLDRLMHAAYPVGLLPAKPGTKYTDQMRHCRSAWDVSLARPDFDGEAK